MRKLAEDGKIKTTEKAEGKRKHYTYELMKQNQTNHLFCSNLFFKAELFS